MKDQHKTQQHLIQELAQLRQSEQRYRTLAEATTDIIYILDEAGKLLYANRSAAAYVGLSPASLVGKTQTDLFPPDVAKRHIARVRRVFETGEAGEMDELYRFGSRDVWLNVRSIPLRDERGRVTSVMGVCRDISDRKQTDEALRQSEQRLSLHFQQTPLGAIEWDLQFRVTRWNPGAERIFGYNAAEALGRHAAFIVPVRAREHVDRIWNDLLARKGEQRSTNENVTKDGNSILCEWYNTPLVDGEGHVVGVASLVDDITERKRTEQALQRAHDELEQRVEERTAELSAANEQLRQSHNELRGIYDGMTDGLLIADVETKRFLRANPAICSMLGYSQGELLSLSVLEIHSKEDLPAVLHAFEEQAAGRMAIADAIPFLRKDGTVFYADVAANRVSYHDRPCVIGFFRDITERRQAREALEKERQTLWHMLQASDHERQLIAYEIHDGLAQYLAAAGMQFQTYAHLRENDPDQAVKAYDAATQLVSQSYFEARRLISGVRPPVLDEAGVETAIAHLVHDERVFKGLKIELQSEIQFDRLPNILENALYRIAQEALTNAWKHSKSKKVKVRLLQEGQKIRLEVQDWGIGFEPEAVEKGHFGLEGIRERVRLLGGKLVIQSSPNRGTLIRVELPIVVQKQGD